MWTGVAWIRSSPSFSRLLQNERKCSLRFFFVSTANYLSTRTGNHRRYDGNGEWRFESDQLPHSRNRMPFEFSNFVIANHKTRTKLIFSHIYFFSHSTSLEDDFSSDPKQTLLPSKCVCVSWASYGANTCDDTDTRSSAIQRFRSTKSNASEQTLMCAVVSSVISEHSFASTRYVRQTGTHNGSY